ncbi:MAG: amidohydrolase family protein [Pseudolabrys sp.]|nr:amidohydrolase family protein [Pseudolabrys sp.]
MHTIDIHTHVLTEETAALLRKEAPAVAVAIRPVDEDTAVLDVAGASYRPFPRGGFDVARRLQDMDRMGVDVHVLSATPQTYMYGHDAALGAAMCLIQNDQIAKLAAAYRERFMGLATLPMQDPSRAADELTRAVRKLGLRGAMFGSNVAGRNLDDPCFEPLWAAAESLDAFMFVHPTNVAGAERLKPYYLVNLIGNPLDTTIAAACLFFGGVMDRHPKLKICLAHAGGFVPYQAGRWLHGWRVRPEPKARVRQEPDDIVKRFHYDSIAHCDESLAFLIAQAGANRVLLGSDYPYDMGMTDAITRVRALDIPQADKDAILGARAKTLLSTRA